MLDPRFKAMSVAERIQLVGDLWESIADEPEALLLTEEQQAEIDRRSDELDADPEGGIPWEVVQRMILQGK